MYNVQVVSPRAAQIAAIKMEKGRRLQKNNRHTERANQTKEIEAAAIVERKAEEESFEGCDAVMTKVTGMAQQTRQVRITMWRT